MIRLTPTQQRYLDFIAAHLQENHTIPTIPEAAWEFEVSITAASDVFRALVKKGHLVRYRPCHQERHRYKLAGYKVVLEKTA